MTGASRTVDVVAMYAGDPNHIASTSAKTPITVSPPSFCITPGTDSVAEGAAIAFEAVGGVPPVRWYVPGDDNYTCNTSGRTARRLT